MGRTKDAVMAPAAAPEILKEAEQAVMLAQNTALSAAETDEVLAAGIDLGRIEAMNFIATVASASLLVFYENVKKSKAWRLLRNPLSSNGSNFESLDEFCHVKLGKTYSRMQHLVSNRNLIGVEAFEQAERLGLRQVDYNAIKALPAPDQELVRRAVEDAQSRDEVLELLQELAARHAKEKETLQAELENERQERAADQQVSDKKSQRIDALERKLVAIERLSPDAELLRLRKEASGIAAETQAMVLGSLRQALLAMARHEQATALHTVFMAGLVGQVQAQLTALCEEFNLPDVSNAADAALAAEVAQWAQ